ncbi:tRNA (adenosine(37)-N6)-threonylcarbamoyltransferase complex transferase subunit TsaD [Rariglobus hedericola]|uniref:tRNA N6-adenosine threonylcarbamoyltransferase n=1 Tax=Rariglobus hedericola TaxID=2597822 RepID=A0A556QES3_9BACT|nr:tRNA (adenosine(37)-N6)-threonylcarbamoyltransferase complex transferase subunit TsaD [Rariglobus hedericola]TSJ75106.1 tRNA (adenosine(37)-N6)-threonylcarbamoyltransferase complex transferase subunit TsaD [Rariglobus hedericola]
MILAIESSCDETALALFDPATGITGEWIHSQIALHGRYGGVVPDLATREHLRNLGPLLERVRESHGFAGIDRVAVTHGPGLAGCLAIGVASAKSLALAWRVPLVGVNHLRGHVFSPFIAMHAEAPAEFDARFEQLLPHLGLVVSGGNTLLFMLDRSRRITVISSTKDDAAGEALDKGAKLLGLGYPGGPLIEQRALQGNREAYAFPRGIGPRADLDFSFSGLKTSLRYQLEKMTPAEIAERMDDLCASYQQAVVDALVRKTTIALERERFRSLGLSGGVANNQTLRAALGRVAKEDGIPLLAAQPRHTGDNAGMIAFAAWVDPHVHALASLGIEPGLAL